MCTGFESNVILDSIQTDISLPAEHLLFESNVILDNSQTIGKHYERETFKNDGGSYKGRL